MKAPTRGGRDSVKRERVFPSSFSSMEVDAPLQSRVSSRVNSFPTSRKRLNGDGMTRAVDMEGSRRDDEDVTLVTPPNKLRTPARLRLSVSRKARESRGDLRDSKTTPFSDYDAALTTTTPESYTNKTVILQEEFPLSDRRRALFEPLGPAFRGPRDADDDGMLPPPDFETASYPQGWVVGKKRKLVNVDVVESMRRIAVHEMNRKDREINGLNEQLEEDSRTMEHLQFQLQQERTKRVQAERENSMLQGQVNMLMNMLNEEPEEQEDVIHGHR